MSIYIKPKVFYILGNAANSVFTNLYRQVKVFRSISVTDGLICVFLELRPLLKENKDAAGSSDGGVLRQRPM